MDFTAQFGLGSFKIMLPAALSPAALSVPQRTLAIEDVTHQQQDEVEILEEFVAANVPCTSASLRAKNAKKRKNEDNSVITTDKSKRAKGTTSIICVFFSCRFSL